MSDQTKFLNAYIENVTGAVHDFLNQNLQLKTQLKLANDAVLEKDGIISSLQNQITNNNTLTEEKNKSDNNARHWESEYNAMKNKVSHMDTLLNQVADMKNVIRQKDDDINRLVNEHKLEIENLNKKISDIEAEKKKINTKKKVTPKLLVENSPPKVVEPEKENNDF